jgi:hypothetical protein
MDKATAEKILAECCRENVEASVRQFMLDLLMTGSAVMPSGEVVQLFPEGASRLGEKDLPDYRMKSLNAATRGVFR